MPYTVDSSDDWQWVDGVVDAVFVTAATGASANVKAKRGDITSPEFTGIMGISPRDVIWTIWRGTAATNDTLTVSGVTYTVIGIVGERPDGCQVTVQTRQEV